MFTRRPDRQDPPTALDESRILTPADKLALAEKVGGPSPVSKESKPWGKYKPGRFQTYTSMTHEQKAIIDWLKAQGLWERGTTTRVQSDALDQKIDEVLTGMGITRR